MRPIGRDVLDELVHSGDLAKSVVARMPTFTVYGTEVEWTAADGLNEVSTPKPSPLRCPDAYRCSFDASEPGCE
jgi:hypothetical protein